MSELTPEKRFKNLEENIDKILRALEGDDFTDIAGLISDVKEMKNEIKGFKELIKKARFIIYGLGLGFAAGGAIFGYAGGKALAQWIQKLLI